MAFRERNGFPLIHRDFRQKRGISPETGNFPRKEEGFRQTNDIPYSNNRSPQTPHFYLAFHKRKMNYRSSSRASSSVVDSVVPSLSAPLRLPMRSRVPLSCVTNHVHPPVNFFEALLNGSWNLGMDSLKNKPFYRDDRVIRRTPVVPWKVARFRRNPALLAEISIN